MLTEEQVRQIIRERPGSMHLEVRALKVIQFPINEEYDNIQAMRKESYIPGDSVPWNRIMKELAGKEVIN